MDEIEDPEARLRLVELVGIFCNLPSIVIDGRP